MRTFSLRTADELLPIKLPEHSVEIARSFLSAFTEKLQGLIPNDLDGCKDSARKIGKFLAEKLHSAPETFKYSPTELTPVEKIALIQNQNFAQSLFTKDRKLKPEKADALKRAIIELSLESKSESLQQKLYILAFNFLQSTSLNIKTTPNVNCLQNIVTFVFAPDFDLTQLNSVSNGPRASGAGSGNTDSMLYQAERIFITIIENPDNEEFNVVTALNNWLDFQRHDFS